MSKLLKLLLGLLLPGVDDPAADPVDPVDPADDPVDPVDPAGSQTDDEDIDFDFVEPTPRAAPKRTTDDRLAGIEASMAEARRIAEERMRGTGAPTAPVDVEFQREEERLRAADLSETERWQINSNRVLRDSQRAANAALFQAQDLNDRTTFESKVAADPHRARYRDRVEAALAEERRHGRNASREAIYYHMLGKDIADGKLKPKAKAKTPAADVPRGRTPAVRSNVQSGRGSTEHQKRAARLENLNI
ncbi:hypothetical protein B0G75_104275 [Paraburkholderia sp. BL18I3N2]|uniref:hypothetical protein n=1 Tax=Paraburkholderia sp. BL18I3N2 TaxID=1938799 RepID=UPI000D05073D|nr:hypothetical protein [Paraburkholderia sp. BL18I3N2]PRX32254.1 hypothetical protein B0G75_104275 [Paraburkholderia sp. BL18I3N2]